MATSIIREGKENTSPDCAGSGVGVSQRERRNATLSYPHIRPFVEMYKGSSYWKSCKGGKCAAVGGGRRGAIKGFSAESRYRLMCLIAKIRRDVDLPCFVTLTYPCEFPSVDRAKRDIKVFFQRLLRAFPGAGVIWKLEPQERGAPHYHLLVWGVNESILLNWVCENWHEIAGKGDKNHYLFHRGLLHDSKPCVSKVRSWRGVWAYAAKYLGKTFEVAEWGDKWTGRFWGVIRVENIPFGKAKIVDLAYVTVVDVMRLQRRFMGKRRYRNKRSMVTFLDVDQWASKVLRL